MLFLRSGGTGSGRTLRRDLGFWATAALSVGGMAPTPAMSVTGVQVARLLGRAAPLAYLLVWLLVARGIRLTARSVIAVEAVSLLLITALIVVSHVRLGTGHAPGRQTLTAGVLRLPPGTGAAAVPQLRRRVSEGLALR